MTNADAKPRRRRPLPGFPERLVSAMVRSGLADAEVGRLTGISRNVLSGYKKGTTFPGVSEVHALCKALEISANQLIFGTEHPFKIDPLRERLGITSGSKASAAMFIFFSMLAQSEQDAVLMIVHALLEARHGKKEIEKADAAIEIIADELGDIAPQLGEAVERMLPPERIKGMEKRLSQRSPPASPGSKRIKRKR